MIIKVLIKYFSILKYEMRSIDMKHFTEHHLIVKNITPGDMGIYLAKAKSIAVSSQLSIVADDKAQGVKFFSFLLSLSVWARPQSWVRG